MNRDQVVETLQMNYHAIKEGKGKWFDKRVAYIIARSFVSKDRRFSDTDYCRMEDTLKAELKLFNLLGQPVRGIILGMLLANGKTKDLDIHILLDDYQRLCEVGFKRSSYSYFSAYLLQYIETAEKEFVVRRGQEIFEELKAHHYFLTGAEDGAIAISLSQQGKLDSLSASQVGELVETYYQSFNHLGFHKSNQLQFAAATAAILTGTYSPDLFSRLDFLINELKKLGIRFKPEFYNSVVTLAFLDTLKPIDFGALKDYLDFIEEKTTLRFYKEFRQSLALGLLINEETAHLSDENLTISALTVTMLMAQEQAAAANSSS